MIIIDGNHLLHRLIFANLETIKGNKEFLPHLLLTSILISAKNFGYSNKNKVVITMDSTSWRKQYFLDNRFKTTHASELEYKGNRKKSVDIPWKTYYELYDETMNMLNNSTDFLTIRVDGAESDDIVAVLAENIGEDCFIISSDKDFVQLYKYENVQIYDPMRKMFKPKEGFETFKKVHILCGDVSDNIPPIRKRLGEKTALKMLAEFDKLILTNSELKENYEFNKTLIDLDCIPEEIKKRIKEKIGLFKNNFKQTEVIEFFRKYHLNRMLENINEFKFRDTSRSTKMNSQNKIQNDAKKTLDDFFK